MNSRYKVIRFHAGAPKLVGFASTSVEASKLLGVETCSVENVRGEGLAFVRGSDVAARREWNAPRIVPQIRA